MNYCGCNPKLFRSIRPESLMLHRIVFFKEVFYRDSTSITFLEQSYGKFRIAIVDED
jgi:hypothetical protein